EAEQPLFSERGQELNGKERIALRLLVHQARQRGHVLRLAAKRIPNQSLQVSTHQRGKDYVLHGRARSTDRLELAHERMGGIDFVVAVRADQHQVPHVRLREKVFDQLERRRVEPLQIVQEQGQRMLRPREYADEPAEHQLEAALLLLWRKRRNRWLSSDDQLQFGNQIHDQLSVRIQRLSKGIAPPV